MLTKIHIEKPTEKLLKTNFAHRNFIFNAIPAKPQQKFEFNNKF